MPDSHDFGMAVGSFDFRTSFQPSPTMASSLTTTAPNGPPSPSSTPLQDSATARCMYASFIYPFLSFATCHSLRR